MVGAEYGCLDVNLLEKEPEFGREFRRLGKLKLSGFELPGKRGPGDNGHGQGRQVVRVHLRDSFGGIDCVLLPLLAAANFSKKNLKGCLGRVRVGLIQIANPLFQSAFGELSVVVRRLCSFRLRPDFFIP